MKLLYLTADQINAHTGGGLVTYQESHALSQLGELQELSREQLSELAKYYFEQGYQDPWYWDLAALHKFGCEIKLAHVYAGTFTESIKKLKSCGSIVTYTCAAHDKDLSKQEHLKLGFPWQYPHLDDEVLWKKYLQGYLLADCIIVPSTYSEKIMRKYGYKGRIEIIPHGCNLPKEVKPFPKKFVCGNLGSLLPDKGFVYLLKAWNKLNYKDATLLIAGSHSKQPWVREFITQHGGGNIQCIGWIKDVSDFYDNISLYIQPSVSEGFGIEVLEAMCMEDHVICSEGSW